MGSLNRQLLAAALLSGMVVAGPGSNTAVQQFMRHNDEDAAPSNDHWRGQGKGRNCNPRRNSNAASFKRAATKRRNLRARASKRA